MLLVAEPLGRGTYRKTAEHRKCVFERGVGRKTPVLALSLLLTERKMAKVVAHPPYSDRFGHKPKTKRPWTQTFETILPCLQTVSRTSLVKERCRGWIMQCAPQMIQVSFHTLQAERTGRICCLVCLYDYLYCLWADGMNVCLHILKHIKVLNKRPEVLKCSKSH